MSEEEVAVPDADEPDEAAIAAEVTGLTSAEPGEQHRRLTAAVVSREKQIRALNKRVKELEPVAARVGEIDTRLGQAQPFIDAIVNNPKLRAEALRISQGTRASGEATDQPADDPDAAAYAEDMGWYLSDGQTVDVARGQRVLARLDARTGRQTDDRIRPLAGVTLGQKAQQHYREALQMVDEDGVPLASEQSIKETWQKLPQALLANPDVVEIAINNAIGLDRRNKRTPKAAPEPLYLESAGGRRRGAEPALTPEEKARATRLGLSEQAMTNAAKSLASGRAITFEDE